MTPSPIRSLASALRKLFPPPLSLGELGERRAARHLRRRGMKIVTRRHRSRYGEFDIIGVEGRTVVFVEVKTRRSEAHGRPLDAVDQHRQDRMVRASLAFLKTHRLLDYPTRFDVVEVVWPKEQKHPTIRHWPNAFQSRFEGQMFA